MFKFGFDLPAEGAGTDVELQQQQEEEEAPQDVSSDEAPSTTSKPPLSVLDMSDAITSVFESDTLFEYVPLLGGGGGGDGTAPATDADTAADASSSLTATAQVQPLRRVVFPPDQKVPPSLSGDAALNRESLADTDLIPGVYEGGLKVWECSLDLCRHLAEEMVRLEEVNAANGNIDVGDDNHPSVNNDVYHALSKTGKTMELGCGHGLPACLILRELRKRWADNNDEANSSGNTTGDDGYSVLFSDYNEFVLRDATVPNIILNMDGDRPCPNDANEWGKVKGCVGCVAGDWMDLSKRLQDKSIAAVDDEAPNNDATEAIVLPSPNDGRFDLILAAETTYTQESSKDTAELLARHLMLNTGVGLVATKRYYFGVGGGADAFRQAAESIVLKTGSAGDKMECILKIETVKSYDSGVGRDLLRVRLVAQ